MTRDIPMHFSWNRRR